jgi:hypothetical protein
MGSPNHLDLGAECRLPLVGIRAPVKGRDGRSAPCSSSAMSSDRLFLDRVARQHCPSPLHRRDQTTMHPRPALAKPDISTLRRIGHFYFALTRRVGGSGRVHDIKVERSWQSRASGRPGGHQGNSACPATDRTRLDASTVDVSICISRLVNSSISLGCVD